uniref:Kinesin-like KIF1-type domain-containing protein n=1 Tax=Guillardia theta TaxID=55529 RepID=A0A6U6BHX5_GUITH|mmetsp:Transcript_3889/g.14189  ORF Transcript_3889/g.14189 Transcript_3889/m.14189 type:complete len:890 (+) Transcript_3889:1375-4044(+)
MPLVATQKRSWFALSLQQTLILKRCSTIRRSCSVMQFKQTVGTLRYADRAKQIKNKPKVNIDPTEMLIQQLKEENERLKQQMGTGGGPPGTVMTEEEKEAMKKQLEDEMAAKMAENEKMLAEMSKSWEEKLKEAQEKAAAEGGSAQSEQKRRETEPHILNINEDPVLSRAICYFFPLGEEINIGNRDRPGEEEILLGGVSIRPDHCRVTNTDGKLIMGVREECKVLLNGADVTGKSDLELHHNDRLLIGTNYYFVVVHPSERDTSPPEEGWPEVTWDMFQREIAKAQGLNVDVNWAAMTEEEKRRALLNDELVQVMPRVQEANALSSELKRDINFETKVTSVMHKTEGTVSVVMVKVINEVTSAEFIWEKDKFINRVYLMRELYSKYLEGTLDPSLFNGDQDPFWDPIEPMNIGYSTIYLKPLSFCMPAEDDYAIYYDSQQAGIMHVKIEPCKPDGAIVDEEEEDGIYDDVENPKDLLGRRLDVLVTVSYARGINKKFSSEVYIEFEFPKAHNPEREDGRYYTHSVRDTMNPNFDFKKQITWEKVDDILLHFLETGSAYFHVFGLQEDKSGTSVQRKKMLSMQQVEELQANFKKMTDDKERSDDIMGKVLERSVVAGNNSEATESFLLEIANLLADAGFDVQTIVDAAQNSSKKLEQAASTSSATPEVQEGGGGDAGELSAKLEEAMKQIAAKDAALKASEEHAATIGKLQEKIKELEASKPSEGGGPASQGEASGLEEEVKELRSKAAMVDELQTKIKILESKAADQPSTEGNSSGQADQDKQLEEARALLAKKEAELVEAKAAEEKARSLAREQEEKHKAELAEKEQAWKSQQQTPDNEEHLKKIIELQGENSKYKEEIIQLKGQLDLARLEAETAKKAGSKGCSIQ